MTYHIPKNAIYTKEDVVNVLNGNKIHYTLAGHDNFYSLGTLGAELSTPVSLLAAGMAIAWLPTAGAYLLNPIFGGVVAFFWGAPVTGFTSLVTVPWISLDLLSATLRGIGLTSADNTFHENLVNQRLNGQNAYFSAEEMCYLLNTGDIESTLNHQVPANYESPINNIGDWHSIAVIDM